jgi:hypothetical protein
MTRLQLTATAPVRLLTRAFLLIAEPRVERVLQFLVYVILGSGGVGILVTPPDTFTELLPTGNLIVFSLFVVIGSAFGLIAVLPGIWWLERAGILALGVGLLIYGSIGIALGSSALVAAITICAVINLAQRWGRIRGAALAPKKVLPSDVGV